jgi:gluconate 2-dehydrogenase gamma chain
MKPVDWDGKMKDRKIARRDVLRGAGAAGTLAAASASASLVPNSDAKAAADPNSDTPQVWLTLTPPEAGFIEAAVDTLIPADDLTPSGSDCGVATFIDRQLAGAFGSGARLYRQGPFLQGKPEHGYQLPLTPREFFAVGIKGVNAWTADAYGQDFANLNEAQRIEAMQALEGGTVELGEISSAGFFGQLLDLAMQGFFADPIYGGNKGKAAWKMIGFPGLPAFYRTRITEYRDRRYDVEPLSIEDFS